VKRETRLPFADRLPAPTEADTHTAPVAPATVPANPAEKEAYNALLTWDLTFREMHRKLAYMYGLWGYNWPWTKCQTHLHAAKIELEILLAQIGISHDFSEPMVGVVAEKPWTFKLAFIVTVMTSDRVFDMFGGLPRYVQAPRKCPMETRIQTALVKSSVEKFNRKLYALKLLHAPNG